MANIVPQDYEHNIIKALQEIIPECPFILAGRNGSEPKQGYCLVGIITEYPLGRAQISSRSKLDKNNRAWQLVQRDYAVNYTMTFIGNSKSKSEEWCRYLSLALESDYAKDAFLRYGMGISEYKTFPRVVVSNNNVVNYITDVVDINIITNRFAWFPVEVINEVTITGDLDLGMNPDVEVNIKWQ